MLIATVINNEVNITHGDTGGKDDANEVIPILVQALRARVVVEKVSKCMSKM